MLQHGSLIVGRAHERLVDLLQLDEGKRAAWKRRLTQDSTCLEQCLGTTVNRDELIGCLVAGFGEVLGVKLDRVELSEEERDRCRERRSAWSADIVLA